MVPPRLADLVRKARRLAAERDRAVDGLATEWANALRGQGLASTDLEELWAGLLEEAVRHGPPTDKWSAAAWRAEAQEVLARVREQVEAALRDQ